MLEERKLGTNPWFNKQLHQTPEGSLLYMKRHGGAGEQNVPGDCVAGNARR